MTTYLWYLTHWRMTKDKTSDYIRHEIWMNMKCSDMVKVYEFIKEILQEN